MPAASYSPPRPIANLDEAAEALRSAGLRFSASRRMILEGLLAAEGPVSAEYLAGGLDGRSSPTDLPSAYRNLELLERLGIVRHVHIGHGPGLYALIGAAERTYLVCESCGELTRLADADAATLRSKIAAATGFEAHFTHFPILGRCRRCAADEPHDPTHQGDAMSDPDHGHDHEEEHSHNTSYAHRHSHGEETHVHAHDTHDHDHTAHEHEHSHGDRVHSHPHVHQEGLEDEHAHSHES